jgi:hypothetical protein
VRYTLVLAAQAAIASPFAYFTLFGTFRPWDDEGTIMRWDRLLLDGLPLYDQVWNIYGPVPYLFRYVLHRFIEVPLSHDVYRFTTLGLWLTSTMLFSLAVYRMTRSLPTAALAHCVAVACLVPIVNEPGHAQGYVAVVLGVVLLLGTAMQAAPRLASGTLGAMVAVMLLTKVNAGLFLGAALAMALAVVMPATRTGVAARLAVGAGILALFPSIVARTAPDMGWWAFTIAATTGVLLTYFTALREGRDEIREREVTWTLVGCLVAAALIIALTITLLGSSLRAILDAVFVASSRHPVWLSSPGPEVSRLAIIGGVMAWIAIAAARRAGKPWYGRIAGTFQAILGLTILGGILTGWSSWLYTALLTWTLPFLWLTALTPHGERDLTARLPRFVLASCAGLQAFYAFPFLGSQSAFATVLIPLCALVCLHDAIRPLVAIFPVGAPAVWLRRTGVAAVAVALIFAYAHSARQTHAVWARRIPLDLPGARLLRLPERDVAAFRWLAYNLAAHCDTFLGAPPFESMYVWGGRPVPTALGGRWFLTFTENQQLEMIDDFERYQRRCVIRNPQRLAFWLGFRIPNPRAQDASLPLLTYINENFALMGNLRGMDPWQLLVEKKRPPLLPTYSARLLGPPNRSSSPKRPARISLRLPASDRPAVTRFQIYDSLRRVVLADSVPRQDVAALTVHRAFRGRTAELLQEPLNRAIPHEITLLTPLPHITRWAVVRLYDAAGKLVDSVPFVES